jgi:hypothetical protein
VLLVLRGWWIMKKDAAIDIALFFSGVFAIFCFGVAALPYVQPEFLP